MQKRCIILLGCFWALVSFAQEYRQVGAALCGAGGATTNVISFGADMFRHAGCLVVAGGAGMASAEWEARAGFHHQANLARPLLDTDTNGIPDELDLDNDGDRLQDRAEITGAWSMPPNPTDPLRFDSDADSYGDGLEVEEQTNPNEPLSFPVRQLLVAAHPAPHGVSQPYAYGLHTNVPLFSVITNEAGSPADSLQGTQFVCRGWTGSGSVPAVGATNQAVFRIETHSQLTWEWTPQYLLQLRATNGGIEGAAPGWHDAGFIFDLVPRASNAFVFDRWYDNELPAGNANPFNITVQAPHEVRAEFRPDAWDLTTTGTAELVGWRLDMGTGLLWCQVRFCNPAGSGLQMLDRFVFAMAPTADLRLYQPLGTNAWGEEYADATALILAATNGLPPGACATPTGEIAFVGRSISGWNGTLYAKHMPDLSARDTDGDAMPNGWENAQGLNQNDPADGSTDTDGDEIPNRDEYGADTNPWDANSYLGFLEMRVGQLVLQGGAAATQYLEVAAIPSGPWQVLLTNAPPTAQTNAQMIVPGQALELYRLRTGR